MHIKTALLAAATLAFAAAPVAAAPAKGAKAAPKAAAAPAAAPAAGGPADPKAQHATLYLRVLIGGLQSDQVEEPVKGALVGCLYDNSLGKITESMDKVIAENPDKVHRDKPAELLITMAQICGYNAQLKPEPAGAPATTTKAPQGR